MQDDVIVIHDIFVLNEFQFESGKTLNDVDVEFSTRGIPKYDDEGKIINAIVYCHPFNGNYSSVGHLAKLIGPGDPFDLNEYFFISITSLGFPESCSPSSTNLKYNFPKYTIKDRVNFRRQFIKEKFGISNVLGVIGRGLGGYETFTWACEYPDEMEFIIIAGSSYKTNGYRYVVSKCVESIIESSDDFYSDVYHDSFTKSMISLNKLFYSQYFSKRIFQNMSNDEIDILMDDFVDEGLFTDIYDFKYRNDAILEYNVEDKLDKIKADSLIISSTDDIYYTPEFDTIPLKDLIENVTVVLFESKRYYTDYDNGDIVKEDIKKFMNNFKK